VEFNHDVYREDHLGDRDVLVLEQIPNWDFRTFADLASWILAVELNARIDARAASKRSAAGRQR
jgi:hypothetical protein